MNAEPTNTQTDPPGDLRAEYDFSAGERGRHHQAFQVGNNLILLDPDVAAVFKDADSVNGALRLLLKLAQEQSHLGRSA